jgi:DNA repair exonuclease SbcCD ATPase subunit
MTPEQQPARKQDITEVRQEITEVRQEIKEVRQELTEVRQEITEVRQELKAAESRLHQEIADSAAHVIEAMRDMQSEMLRGIEAFARGNFCPSTHA